MEMLRSVEAMLGGVVPIAIVLKTPPQVQWVRSANPAHRLILPPY